MNRAIRTYEDLVEHKQKLKELLDAQKRLIHYDIEEIKEELRPLTNIVGVASKFFTRNNDHSLLVNGVNSLIDLALKKIVLPGTGWISHMIIPFFAKNISSHLVAENKKGVFDKVASWVAVKKEKSI